MTSFENVFDSGDPEELYALETVVGHGHFGKVYKARHKETDEVAAIKILPWDQEDEDSNKKLLKEIQLMKECACENIVKFYGSYLKENDLWIVMEFCDAGSLAMIIGKTGQGFTERQISLILKDMLIGLEYLHARRMLHRDIKADNVLLCSNGLSKLADLGVAAQLTNTMDNRKTATGTPYWMAPELILEQAYNSEVDIWSLGITAIEYADKKPPFFDMVPMRALFIIATGDQPPPTLTDKEKWSPEFHDFIAKCLVKNPQNRASASELLKHPFIQNAAPRSELQELAESFIAFKEQKRVEKETRKKNMKDRRRSVGAGIMRKISQLDDNQLTVPKGASDPRCGNIYPISPGCALMKETTPWEFLAIGGPPDLDKPKHVLSNISNVQRATIDDSMVAFLFEMASHQKTGIERKVRIYRLRNHRDSFYGSDAVDWFMARLSLDREEGVAIGEALMHRGLIQHVLRCEPFQDSKNSLYRLAEITDRQTLQELCMEGKLTYLVDMMRWGVNITTRRWRHKTYEKAFLGNEAVDWLIKTLNLPDRQQATRLGQILLDRCIFHHVTFSDTFADKPALYRFFQDDKKFTFVTSQIRQSALEKANCALKLASEQRTK